MRLSWRRERRGVDSPAPPHRLGRGDRVAAEGFPGAEAKGLQVFGLDVFRRSSKEFAPALAGPIDPSYVLGPGDLLVLVITGDVERSQSLDVNREGFILIPQVGQVFRLRT